MNIIKIGEDFVKNGRRSMRRIFKLPETRVLFLRLMKKKYPELRYADQWKDAQGYGLQMSETESKGEWGDGWYLLCDPWQPGREGWTKAYYLRRWKRKHRDRNMRTWKAFFRKWGTEGWRGVMEHKELVEGVPSAEVRSKNFQRCLDDLMMVVEQEKKNYERKIV